MVILHCKAHLALPYKKARAKKLERAHEGPKHESGGGLRLVNTAESPLAQGRRS
jgi:hypothetical protein